jgi:hypothetical protein
MRVSFATIVIGTALLLTACSGGADGVTLQRGRSAASTRSPSATNAAGSGDSDSTASSTSASTPAPATPPADSAPPGSDAGTGTTPAPAPAPAAPALGSCGNPKCFGLNGVGGCKATDSAGDEVTMGCHGGGCVCFTADQTTATFDGDITSADDAAQLFLTHCTCN